MADSYWHGLAVADGTTITTANDDTAGNQSLAPSHALAYTESGTITSRIFSRQSSPIGPGLSITAGASTIARLDLTQVSAIGGGCQLRYTASAAPTTSDGTIILVRSASANVAQVSHTTSSTSPANVLQFRDSGGTTAVTNGTTPALTAGHTYQIDLVVTLNSGTPSTSNGRLIGRVISLSDGTWNTTGEFFVDTGYTINVGTADITTWRVGKVNSPSVQAQTYYTGIRWGERTVDTTIDSAIARMQLIDSRVQRLSLLTRAASIRAHYW